MYQIAPLQCLIYLSCVASTFAVPTGIATKQIPSRLGSILPSCASECIATVLAREWSQCGSEDLLCTCGQGTKAQFTLGERSLQCVASSCGISPEGSILAQLYNICSEEKGALPNTHSTLTATSSLSTKASKFLVAAMTQSPILLVTTEDTTESAASSLPSVISNPALSAAAFDTQLATAAAAPLVTASVLVSTTSSTSNDPSPAATISSRPSSQATIAAPTAPQDALTKGQIIGIAVAGVASASLSVAAILFCGFLRRRKDAKRHGDNLNFNGAASQDVRGGSYPPPSGRHPANRTRSQLPRRKQIDGASFKFPTAGKEHFSFRQDRNIKAEEIGVAIAVDPNLHNSGQRKPRKANSRHLSGSLCNEHPAPIITVHRPWSEHTHIEDSRVSYAESCWDEESCRTSQNWDLSQWSLDTTGLYLGARSTTSAVPPAFQSILPAPPQTAHLYLPRETNRHGLMILKPEFISTPLGFPRRKPLPSQTPCNSMWRRSNGSDTEFEEIDDDDESPLVPDEELVKGAKKVTRPVLTQYPSVQRSPSGWPRAASRVAQMSYHDGAVLQGGRRAVDPPRATER